jgi:methylglutaconyl-CoA hydratase
MTDEVVHFDVAAGVARITLDSPENRNALSRRLTSQLLGHLEAAQADPRARVILLTHTGTVFCAGADLKEQRAANEAGTGGGPGLVADILKHIWDSPKPVVGRIGGHARAGGIGLMAACDIAVAAEGATFAINEVRLGLIPAMISVVILPKLGLAKALELFLTGETFGPDEAARIGLITAAVSAEELDATVDRYLEALLRGGPEALGGAKRLVRDVPAMPMEEAFPRMAELSGRYFASAEALEGMRAFAERRQPRWSDVDG